MLDLEKGVDFVHSFLLCIETELRRIVLLKLFKIGNSRIHRLLLADKEVFMALSKVGPHHALDRFAAGCDSAGMKIIVKKTEVYRFLKNLHLLDLEICGETLKQVEKSWDNIRE